MNYYTSMQKIYQSKITKYKYIILKKYKGGLCICKKVEPLHIADLLCPEITYYIDFKDLTYTGVGKKVGKTK